MLTAHLPSDFIEGRLAGVHRTIPTAMSHAMPVALMASVQLDFGIIWFHLADRGSIDHHRYWVHILALWTTVAAITLPVLWRSRWRDTALMSLCALP